MAPVAYGGSEKILLYGGGAGTSTLFAETWIYDPTTNLWTLCATCGSPTGRALMAFAERPATHTQMMMFGGMKNDNVSSFAHTYQFE